MSDLLTETTLIRSTKHAVRFANVGKSIVLLCFLAEYRRVAGLYLDELWANGCEWSTEDKKTGVVTDHVMDIGRNLLDHPAMLSNPYVEARMGGLESGLSGRARKCCLTQVLGMIGAAVEKQRRRLFRLADEPDNAKLKAAIERGKPVKPTIGDSMKAELNSICADWRPTHDSYFNGFLGLSSIGEEFGEIHLPVKFHRCNKKFKRWKMLKSFLISEQFIDIRWTKKIEPKKRGKTQGGDQGKLTVLTLSSGKITQECCKHGHTLSKIVRKLSGRKKDSVGFHKAQDHRKNFINWSLKSLNLAGIKRVNLEKIFNINHGKVTSREMTHWTNTLIRDELVSLCEMLGVQVFEQSSTYRSQRCSSCGLVRKANRKGKQFSCSSCGLRIDADLNAARNHEQSLPDVPVWLRQMGKNRGCGFYWKSSGFFSISGSKFTVSDTKEMVA